jgi:hypothetical protein
MAKANNHTLTLYARGIVVFSRYDLSLDEITRAITKAKLVPGIDMISADREDLASDTALSTFVLQDGVWLEHTEAGLEELLFKDASLS